MFENSRKKYLRSPREHENDNDDKEEGTTNKNQTGNKKSKSIFELFSLSLKKERKKEYKTFD